MKKLLLSSLFITSMFSMDLAKEIRQSIIDNYEQWTVTSYVDALKDFNIINKDCDEFKVKAYKDYLIATYKGGHTQAIIDKVKLDKQAVEHECKFIKR